MFLVMQRPLELGTRVALSLEAAGRVLPFAQGEVVWTRGEGGQAGAFPSGLGVRFTDFLHPRANDLVDHIVHARQTGKPLQVAIAPSWRSSLGWLGAGVAGVGLAVCGLLLGWQLAAVTRVVDPLSSAEGVAGPQLGPGLVGAASHRPASPEPSARELPSVDFATAGGTGVDLAPGFGSDRSAVESDRVDGAKVIIVPVGPVPRIQWASAREELRLKPELAPGAVLTRQFLLADPPRLVFDIQGAAPRRSYAVQVPGAPFKRVRVGRQGLGTRVVFDLVRSPTGIVQEAGASILSF
jgi:hypothetical protein